MFFYKEKDGPELNPDDYLSRYDYIPGEAAAGVVIYDDKFVYSNHATDPVCGKLLNAFDLVRLHKFSELDDNYAEDTPVALESDERRGIVREYLMQKLPDNWDAMTLYERRNFLNGESEFGGGKLSGTKARTSVSNMEVWCECFGKDRADLSISEGNRIKGILIKLGWHRYEKKVRLPIYGAQWVYVPDGNDSP